MSDTTLNRFLAQGTNAERLAFVPDPATPASGPDPGYIWWETDTGDTYAWDIVGAAWVLLVASSPGTVTTVSVASANGFAGSVADPTTTPAITISTSVTGILVGNGTAVAAAVAGDFPTLNQNTTGSAATLTTPRAIYGNNFDGSAALTQVIAAAFGGTGNGFTKFSGPTTAEKTFTLPDANATLAFASATLTADQVVVGNGTAAVKVLAAGTDTFVLTMVGGVPVWAAGGSGSGTVNSGTANQLAYYAASGTAVSTLASSVVSAGGIQFNSTATTSQIIGNSPTGFGSIVQLQINASGLVYFGAAGTTDNYVTGTVTGDTFLRAEGGNFLLSTTSGGGSYGFRQNSGSAGTISHGTGTFPIVVPLSVTGTSGNVPLAVASIGTACQIVSNAPAGFSSLSQLQINSTFQAFYGVAGATDAYVTGNATNDSFWRCQAANFNVSTDSGGAIGFQVVAANGGIRTSAPSGGTAAAWKLGTVSVTSPTAPNRTIELDVAGTRYFLAAKTTND